MWELILILLSQNAVLSWRYMFLNIFAPGYELSVHWYPAGRQMEQGIISQLSKVFLFAHTSCLGGCFCVANGVTCKSMLLS